MMRDAMVFLAGAVCLLAVQMVWGYWLLRRDQATWLGWRQRKRFR